MTEHHPSNAELLEACEAAPSGVPPHIASHMEGRCPRCAERIVEYRAILASLRTPPLEVVPAELIRAALEQLSRAEAHGDPSAFRADSPPTFSSRLASAIREVAMSLVLDTRLTPAVAGVRGPGPTARRLIFESPQASLHLEVRESAAGKRDLIGQIVPRSDAIDPTRMGVRVLRGKRSTRALVETTGEFRLQGVAGGSLELRVECDDVALRAGPLEL